MGAISLNVAVRFFVVCVSLLFFIHTVNGIRCFQCNSIRDSGCAEITNNSSDNVYLKECEARGELKKSVFFCRTTTLTIKEHGDMARVIRSCGWEKYPRECYENDDEDHNERVCQCFTDGCNSRASPNSLRPMAATTIVGIPLLVILYRAF